MEPIRFPSERHIYATLAMAVVGVLAIFALAIIAIVWLANHVRVVVVCLVFAAVCNAAPRLKDKGYSPDGWIDVLCNQPPSERPWLAMENCVCGMDRETWMEVGREVSKRMRARFKRLGLEHEWPSVFDKPDDEIVVGHVAGVLWHYKWIEINKCDADPFWPPASFWDSGTVEPNR